MVLLESMGRRLAPVREAIAQYDAGRPLTEEVRKIKGVAEAYEIAGNEAEELRGVRRLYDGIPKVELNGQRAEVSKELGDLTFGVALALGMLSIEQMNRKQRDTLLYWTNLIQDTEHAYDLDAVVSGVNVNQVKNVINNPTWAYADYHPLDNPVQAVDRHDDVRRGLRVIRDMDPKGVLVEENLAYAVDYMGYQQQVLIDNPVLATAFLRQVAIRQTLR